ncbi:MAG: hypothetical protein LBU02_01250 [Rickettsiales bacterium]|jgi:molybdopterin converting factor small subunit|nr:hypothetical protein [Rickettsiales bacterium]
MEEEAVENHLKGILAVALCCVTVDVIAIYGKINGGISYIAAQNGNATAKQKIAEAKALANKISLLKPSAFNNLPNGMSPEEFIYELLNWPANTSSNQSIKITEDIRKNIMSIEQLNNRENRVKFNEVIDKLVLGCSFLSEAKIIDQRITKKAVSEVLEQLSQLDNKAKKLLDQLRADVINGSISGKIGNYAGQFQQIYEKSSVDFDAILSQKYAEVPGSVRLAEPNSRTHVAAKESITSKRAVLNALLDYIKSLADRPLHSIETQTDPIPAVTVSEAETQIDLTGQDVDQLQSNLAAKQTEIDRQHKVTRVVNASNQEFIAQLQAENTTLRNMSAEEARCHIFRHRLIGLLVRAKDGYDYRLPFNHEEYMKRFTVSRTVDGVFTQQHGFPKEDWLQVKGLIDECIELLSGIGPVTATNRKQWNVISSKIIQMFGLLNFNRFSKDTTENKQEYAARKIKVGRTLKKLLDTIGAYLAEEELPLDPPEIINNEENPEVVTIENMCAWLKKAAK